MLLHRKHKKINYVKALRVPVNKPKINKAVLRVVFSLAFFIVVITSVYLITFFENNSLENELSEINDYINDESNQALYDKSEYDYNVVLSDLNSRQEALEVQMDSWELNPGITAEYLEKILNCNGTNVLTESCDYDDSTGVMTLGMIAKDSSDIYDYIDRLGETGIIDDINYNGYNVYDDGFSFTIYCHIMANGSGE